VVLEGDKEGVFYRCREVVCRFGIDAEDVVVSLYDNAVFIGGLSPDDAVNFECNGKVRGG